MMISTHSFVNVFLNFVKAFIDLVYYLKEMQIILCYRE